MEDVPTRICVCIIGASGVPFVTGFFLREVSVFHSFSSHVDTNNMTMCEVAIHELYFPFLFLSFTLFCSNTH